MTIKQDNGEETPSIAASKDLPPKSVDGESAGDKQ
jgi:hypothetical protein